MIYRALRPLVLPLDLTSAPGGFNVWLAVGDQFEVTDAAVARNGRFLANRLTLGDLVAVAEQPKEQ